VLGADEELLLVSERGVIVRMRSNAVPQQSRAATGVRLQRLDAGDHLAEVVLVPPAAAEAETDAESEGALGPDVAASGAGPEAPPTDGTTALATAAEDGSAEPDDVEA
jgi:DNA gyrase subunit A